MTQAVTDRVYDALIVGAGICGLMAAGRLLDHGASVLMLDKGRSVGGRLATRRIGAGRADHGAQFFTVRSAPFQEFVTRWLEQNLVFRWSTGWSDGSLATETIGDGHPRYAVHSGMNSLPRHLASLHTTKGAEILTGVKVASAAPTDEVWVVTSEDGRAWHGRSLMLTPPAPQSRGILDAGGTKLAADDRQALAAISYAPCLCAMLLVDASVWLPAPGAVQRSQDDIAWIADNQRKGISPAATVLTLHASPAWSAAHYDDSDEDLIAAFRAALEPWLNSRLDSDLLRAAEVKRWRYALPTVLHPAPYLRPAGVPPLYVGGDGFASPRVEGAALSGLAIADALVADLA
ncbi:MAG: FAD-dependent oxidoreductase [Caldilineaceae bacterium]